MTSFRAFVLGALCLAVVGQAGAGEFNSVLSIGDTMPGFSDLSTADGKTLSSDDLKAPVVVIVSLANHCPWVRGMDPDLVKLASQFDKSKVDIVGFAVGHREQDRLPAMREHAVKTGYTFPYVYDESQKLGRNLGATRTPEYFVFDKDRKLVYSGLLYDSPARINSSGVPQHIAGEPSEFYVADAITATLAGEPVKVAETRAHGCSVKYEK